ncbi:MAG: DUF6691 family protein [Pseudomonadota bacterium]
MRLLASFLIGLIFGLGLVISQMINPAKILGFLDISGNWDPTLLVVMGAALVTTLIGYRLVLGRPKPLLDAAFHLPTKTAIDRPLLIGAAIFGLGWGMAGLCPGPGISAAALGGVSPWAFVAAMLAGMQLQRVIKV